MFFADDGREAKVREAGTVTLVDEDICLVFTVNGCVSAD